MRFKGKVVLVTGGGSGIGRATSVLFAREGAHVIVADKNETGANETLQLIESEGGRGDARACDISDESNVRACVQYAQNQLGRLDCLVNNAATFIMKGCDEAQAEDWFGTFSVNVVGTATCSRIAAEAMKRIGGGTIVNIASINGLQAASGYATYCSSKAAILMLTRCMAIEYGRWGIRVNCISPGAVQTPALERELERTKATAQEFERDVVQKQCLRRRLRPEDIARPIAFLASDEAEMISGTNLVVDGGLLAGG